MALPAVFLLVAQKYNLVIRTTAGEEITLSTEEIDSMEFEEVYDGPRQLATPTPKVTQDGDKYVASWNAVAGASHYVWRLVSNESNSSSLTYNTSYTFTNLQPGQYEFRVMAAADEETTDIDSEYGTVTFVVAGELAGDTGFGMIVENYTHNQARITFLPSEATQYEGAVMEASAASDDAAIAAYVNGLSADKKVSFTGRYTTRFEDLKPSTAYVVAAVSGDKVYSRSFTTEDTPMRGTKVSVFAPGVSMAGGFIDVDKVGKTVWGEDNPLCWAAAASAMCQWWLNDYEANYGTPYPIAHPLPSESLYYSTPIMDVYSMAWVIQAGNVQPALEWFFAGREHPEAYFVNDIIAYNLDYEYVKGGWAGMTIDEFKRFHDFYDRVDMYGGGKTQEEVKEIFADNLLGWLRHGPVYFDISKGNHALVAWGAEYTVQTDGSKVITKLYFAENDLVGANLKNALQEATVDYSNLSGTTNFPYIYSGTISGGGGQTNGDIGNMIALKSWASVYGK